MEQISLDVTTFHSYNFLLFKAGFIATRTPPEDEGALAYGYQEEGPARDKEARESYLPRERKMPEAR